MISCLLAPKCINGEDSEKKQILISLGHQVPIGTRRKILSRYDQVTSLSKSKKYLCEMSVRTERTKKVYSHLSNSEVPAKSRKFYANFGSEMHSFCSIEYITVPQTKRIFKISSVQFLYAQSLTNKSLVRMSSRW